MELSLLLMTTNGLGVILLLPSIIMEQLLKEQLLTLLTYPLKQVVK
jgi:hypothetical protein